MGTDLGAGPAGATPRGYTAILRRGEGDLDDDDRVVVGDGDDDGGDSTPRGWGGFHAEARRADSTPRGWGGIPRRGGLGLIPHRGAGPTTTPIWLQEGPRWPRDVPRRWPQENPRGTPVGPSGWVDTDTGSNGSRSRTSSNISSSGFNSSSSSSSG